MKKIIKSFLGLGVILVIAIPSVVLLLKAEDKKIKKEENRINLESYNAKKRIEIENKINEIKDYDLNWIKPNEAKFPSEISNFGEDLNNKIINDLNGMNVTYKKGVIDDYTGSLEIEAIISKQGFKNKTIKKTIYGFKNKKEIKREKMLELKENLTNVVPDDLIKNLKLDDDNLFIFEQFADFGRWFNYPEIQKILLYTKDIGEKCFYSQPYSYGDIDITTLYSPNIQIIHANAFSNQENLSAVILPRCQEIGEKAFEKNIRINDISLPECTVIHNFAFSNNEFLESIYLPKIKLLGENVFEKNKIMQSIDLPEITHISNECFCSNFYMEFVKLPKVETIDEKAFCKSRLIEKLYLPKCKKIGLEAFADTLALKELYLPAVEIIEARAFIAENNLTSLNLPNLKTIDEEAFYSNTKIESLIIPYVTEIKESAFHGIPEFQITTYDLRSLFAKNVAENNSDLKEKAGNVFEPI